MSESVKLIVGAYVQLKDRQAIEDLRTVTEKHLSAEELQEFVDGGLDAAHLPRIEEHLSWCAECKGDVAALREFARNWKKPTPVPRPGAAQWAARRLSTHGKKFASAGRWCVIPSRPLPIIWHPPRRTHWRPLLARSGASGSRLTATKTKRRPESRPCRPGSSSCHTDYFIPR